MVYVHKVGAAALVVAFCNWPISLVLLLKSFVYIVYHVTTTVVRWDWQHLRAPEQNDPKPIVAANDPP